VSPPLTTFLFELVNFLLLALVLGWLFFKPVRKALQDRREKVALQLSEAAQQLAEAERTRTEIQARARRLDEELEQRRRQLEQSAQQEAGQILASARQKAQQEREVLKAEFEASRLTHARQLAKSAALAAGRIVEKLLSEMEGPPLQESLERAACRQLAGMNGQLGSSLRVESQAPLTDETRALIERSTQQPARDIEYCVLPALGAGVRIITSQGMIDATVAGLATFAEQALVRELETATL
jgi:F-type H+-transporting ATPase subunit b